MFSKELFGFIENRGIYLYTITNESGMAIKITNYGCAIVSVMAADRNKCFSDVVLGFDTVKEYIGQKFYVGTVIGRCANRIENGSMQIAGKTYKLNQNEGAHHLHGGVKGFHDVLWEVVNENHDSVVFRYFSPDGEEGYPGSLETRVSYELTYDNEIVIRYHAYSDQDTVINLTNHSYFNLSGHQSGSIENHQLQLTAETFAQIDSNCLPTGNILPVAGTPLDLRQPKRLGDILCCEDQQLLFGSGLNHHYVLAATADNKSLRLGAILKDDATGRTMEVYTDRPGLQVYTGNYLNGSLRGKGNTLYERFAGLCLETQGYPDAIHHNAFPTTIIKEGKVFSSVTMYKFAVD